jgi:hypothetical protein
VVTLEFTLVFGNMDDVGDFYVNKVDNVQGSGSVINSKQMISSNQLLRGKVSVLHFYDGG